MLAVAVAFAACTDDTRPPLVASGIEITAAVAGSGVSAGYLTLSNQSDTELHVTAISSPDYEAVEIHRTTLAGGVAKMRRIEALAIPPHESVTLERSGLHLMLMRRRNAAEKVTLNFYSGDAPLLTVVADVAAKDSK